jgi:hypothetical protein
MGNLVLPGEFFNNDIGVGQPVVVNQTYRHIKGKNAVAGFLYPVASADFKAGRVALNRRELQDAVDFAGHSHGIFSRVIEVSVYGIIPFS